MWENYYFSKQYFIFYLAWCRGIHMWCGFEMMLFVLEPVCHHWSVFLEEALFSSQEQKKADEGLKLNNQKLAVAEDVVRLWTCTLLLCNPQPLACTLGSAPAWFDPPNSSKNTHWWVGFQTEYHGQLEVFQWGWQMKQSPSRLYFSPCGQAAIKKNENTRKNTLALKVGVSTSSHGVQWSQARVL